MKGIGKTWREIVIKTVGLFTVMYIYAHIPRNQRRTQGSQGKAQPPDFDNHSHKKTPHTLTNSLNIAAPFETQAQDILWAQLALRAAEAQVQPC